VRDERGKRSALEDTSSIPLMLLSPLGERLGEGMMQEEIFDYPLT
jgi:hypothetical protein